MSKFSLSSAVKFGWETVKSNLVFFIVLEIIAIFVPSVVNSLASSFSRSFPLLSFLLFVVGLGLRFVISLGLLKIALMFVDGKKAQLEDLFSVRQPELVLKYIGAAIIYVLLVGVGLLFLIIPGIYFLLSYFFYNYAVIDKGAGPIDALRISGNLTRGVKLDLLVFLIVLLAINLLGLLVFLVGVLVTLPISMLATAYVYRKLSS
jgi:uncharacterized membrane protein